MKKPRKPIPRRTPLPRPTRAIRSRKADESKRRWAKHRCDPYRESLKLEACCITGKYTEDWYTNSDGWLVEVTVDPAHTRPRSLGADDLYQCLPLARHLHEEQERIGWPRFERKYGIARKAIAREHTERWLATEDGQAWLAEYPECMP